MIKLLLILVPFSIHWAQAADKKVSIGLASNFSALSTVTFNPFGGYFRNGVNLALQEYQENLQKKSITIILKEFDYGADDLNVLKIAEETHQSDVLAVIGYNYSSNALIAAPVHVKNKLPMLSPSASANRLGTFGRYVHLGSFSNEYMAQVLARFAIEQLKAKNVLIIPAANCAYCIDLSNTFEKELTRMGGKVVSKVSILQEDKNFDCIIPKIKDSNFDAVFIPNQELTAARIISSLLEAHINKPFLGADGWGNEGSEFFTLLKGKKFEGYSVTHWHPELKKEKSRKFVETYKKKYGRIPNDTSVLAYDYMSFLLEAILRTEKLDRESLENALNNVKNYEGITGKYLINANKAPYKDILILKTKNDRFVIDKVISAYKDRPL